MHADVSSTRTLPALEELQTRPQWVCWHKEARKGKPTKVPYNPRTGTLARCDDPSTWAMYAEACSAWHAHPDRYDGLGYVFCGDYTGIDFDHCFDDDSRIEAWAWQWIERLASYTEYSPGDGVHVFLRGIIPAGIRRKLLNVARPDAAIEMYCERRYFTITGRHVEGTPQTLEDRPDEVAALYDELTTARGPQERKSRGNHETSGNDLPDAALIEKAMVAKNGMVFRALWNGESAGYASQSEAELALCNLLAFWTGKDAARMDRLFRQSGLYRREKWDRPARSGESYGQGTIARAIAACQQGYAPGGTAPRYDKIIPFPTRRSAATPGLEQLGELPATDLALVLECLKREEEGDALLYAHLFRDKCLYDHTEGTWYEWRRHYWEPDACKHALLLASGPLAAVYLEASALLSEQAAAEAKRIDPAVHDEETDQLKERYNWLKATTADLIERARLLRKLKRAQSVLTYAQALLNITSAEWDTNPWLLGTKEGVLDLRTGALRPGQPGDHLRTVIPTTWHGLHAQAPRFERFLHEIFADRQEEVRADLIAFLQRALGYGITGHTNEHIFLMLYGEEGRNGKDTLMSVLHHVLGQAAGAVSNDVIIATSKLTVPGAAKPHLCALQGKRMAWASETDRGARFDVGQVKFLTGGGAIPARQLYGKDYTFPPSHLLILLTNHKPHADARDAAFWDRLCPILFNLRFVEHPMLPNERQRDTRLSKALEAEAGGILAWLVRGCLIWQRDGLQIPASVIQARGEYQGEEDTLGQFLQECCVMADEASSKAADLYERYKAWAQENALKPMTGLSFGQEIKKLYPHKRDHRGVSYLGVGLPEEASSVGWSDSAQAAQDGARGAQETPLSVGCVGTSQETPSEGGQKATEESYREMPTPLHQSTKTNTPPAASQGCGDGFNGQNLPYTNKGERGLEGSDASVGARESPALVLGMRVQTPMGLGKIWQGSTPIEAQLARGRVAVVLDASTTGVKYFAPHELVPWRVEQARLPVDEAASQAYASRPAVERPPAQEWEEFVL